jgi:hypothetical protein
MFQMIILICSVSVPQPDCQPRTAIQVLRAAQLADGAAACGFGGQAFLASLSIAPGANEYAKTICVRPAQPAPDATAISTAGDE